MHVEKLHYQGCRGSIATWVCEALWLTVAQKDVLDKEHIKGTFKTMNVSENVSVWKIATFV